MRVTIYCYVFIVCLLTLAGCREDPSAVESISIDFPHGETRLIVWKDGNASLFYGALPQSKTIKTEVFDITKLYQQLKPRLHPNVPREDWPNPQSIAGMVQVKIKDKGKSAYLIFDEQEFTKQLFDKARQNITDEKL